MGRNIAKSIADYRKRYYGKRTNEAAFYASDVMQLLDMIDYQKSDAVYHLAFNALEAGFMIGYRKAQRDQRKKRQ